MIELDNKRIVIFGLMGSGKTELVKSILRTTVDHIVYDPLDEYQGFTRYSPTDRHSSEELDQMVNGLVLKKRPRLFIVDEANRYIQPKPKPLPPSIADLNDHSRHWNIAWGLVCRRPTQFHSDVVELAHLLFIFGLHGKNDRQYFNDLKSGLGDVVDTLPQYHFVVVNENRDIEVHKPIETFAAVGR